MLLRDLSIPVYFSCMLLRYLVPNGASGLLCVGLAGEGRLQAGGKKEQHGKSRKELHQQLLVVRECGLKSSGI